MELIWAVLLAIAIVLIGVPILLVIIVLLGTWIQNGETSCCVFIMLVVLIICVTMLIQSIT